jgi:catechol 2,3-dioxygenase-like lactoylglutathione lyase family enzyme
MTHLHHSAIVARDIDASLRFWRDGIGLSVLMDNEFDGDWPTLFGAVSKRLRSVFLGDPARPDGGIVELVGFGETDSRPVAPVPPAAGFFLLSFSVEVDAVLDRLSGLGFDDPPRRITMPGADGTTVQMATVRDPDGVLVELIGMS